ncbi:hypothetical protein [Paenibacillus odorifer]|uniref:hypothetical protein n=1 Tax=Paenibacillus odorifer TaxID=189426 RepID=UPI00096F7F13|nr:hypothetical protein [Paenibacillus odorifer]OMD75296.1 hypothetical protein BSK50_19035 [Paenibacillus odorifer]
MKETCLKVDSIEDAEFLLFVDIRNEELKIEYQLKTNKFYLLKQNAYDRSLYITTKNGTDVSECELLGRCEYYKSPTFVSTFVFNGESQADIDAMKKYEEIKDYMHFPDIGLPQLLVDSANDVHKLDLMSLTMEYAELKRELSNNVGNGFVYALIEIRIKEIELERIGIILS